MENGQLKVVFKLFKGECAIFCVIRGIIIVAAIMHVKELQKGNSVIHGQVLSVMLQQEGQFENLVEAGIADEYQ